MVMLVIHHLMQGFQNIVNLGYGIIKQYPSYNVHSLSEQRLIFSICCVQLVPSTLGGLPIS